LTEHKVGVPLYISEKDTFSTALKIVLFLHTASTLIEEGAPRDILAFVDSNFPV
jgi:hypothetical protein